MQTIHNVDSNYKDLVDGFGQIEPCFFASLLNKGLILKNGIHPLGGVSQEVQSGRLGVGETMGVQGGQNQGGVGRWGEGK